MSASHITDPHFSHGTCTNTPLREYFPQFMAEPTDAGSEVLSHAFKRVLRPFVRLLIARGVSFQSASEWLKQAYVEAGVRHFPESAHSASRLSLLTGLNRKEIKRLTNDNKTAPRAIISFAAAVYQAWRLQRRWRVRSGPLQGQPKLLPRHGDGSFDELVRSVTQDHRPAALFDELVRLGYIKLNADDTVALVTGSFLSRQTFTDRLTPLVENLQDHCDAAVTNVLQDDPVFLERSLFADELSDASAQTLQQRAREHWQNIHDVLIEEANQLEAADAAQRPSTQAQTRIRIGMYVYIEPEPRELKPSVTADALPSSRDAR